MFGIRKLCAVMACILTIHPIAAYGTAIPYMPPSDAYIWGYIYNALGVTALDDTITDKAQKYWDFYASLVNGVNSALYQDMKEVFSKAKTSRQIELSVAQTDVLQQLGKKAIQEGVTLSEQEANTNVSYNDILLWSGIPTTKFTQSDYNDLMTRADRKIGSAFTVFAVKTTQGATTKLYLFAYQANKEMQVYGPGSYGSWSYGFAFFPGYKSYYSNVWKIVNYASGVEATYTNRDYCFTPQSETVVDYKNWGKMKSTAAVSAQNQSIIDALINGVDLILTAHSQVVDGNVDDTKPVIIDIPITLPVPAITVPDLPSVQDDLGVLPLPLTEDAAATVAEMQETKAAELGDTSDYALDLTRFFPFCLPFDMARIIAAFVAEPEAPSFSYTIKNPFSNKPEDDITLTIDLAPFDAVASILRTLESIVFVVGLCAVTRQLYLRG